MATNPLYYTRRHSSQIQASNPNMTQERYMQGYDRANSLVNTMIGVANEVARLAISDGIDAIKRGGTSGRRRSSSATRRFAGRRSTRRYTTRTSATV